MTDTPMTDARQREQALDPQQSFIVQAPAGSGKTELLTQRYLRLLSLADYPEEIAAITFTRKAAAEMRARVLAAIDSAQHPAPAEAHKQHTWHLARAAAARDLKQGWHLNENPNRLRIQTFDSLATELTRQMPLVAEIGAAPGIRENAEALYRQAARNTLGALEDPELKPHLSRVLRHLDNQLGVLETLIADLLGRRDQWLSHVFSAQHIGQLEAALRSEIEQQLQRINTAFPAPLMNQLVHLAGYAADHIEKTDSPIKLWAERKFRPATDWESLPLWRGLSELLLTKDPKVRSKVDKRQGFPSAGEKGLDDATREQRDQAKEAMHDLLKQVGAEAALLEPLMCLPALPIQGYSEHQARLLESLMHCLLHAAAELKLVFAETGEVDFVELGQRALLALGSEEQPTDLALALDYRLKHLLVDEFQDTSSTQHRLLRQLTAGWQPGDGRSLLLVGDPMQSIYRFREAEVGLYLQTRSSGLGSLPLQALTLEMNFRSQAGVVEWVNQTFAQLFPATGDATRGAVPYAASAAAKPLQAGTAVQIHGQIERDDDHEAQQISALIRRTLEQHPDDSIAVLARSRSHLAHIAKALQQAGIAFAAVDVDPLANRPVVQDLRSLTRALLHPADRLAWLAVLRAPWLGLSIPDLLLIAEHSQLSIWRRLQDETLCATLSKDGQTRIQRLKQVLGSELPARGRQPLRSWIEGIWLALGGLAVAGPVGHEDAKAFFALLETLTPAGQAIDLAELDQQMAKLYAAPDSRASGQLQIMTMHAAKGLEFDTVILPGLGRSPRSADSELLYWAETPDPDRTGDTQLLMAPIRARQEKQEPISDFIRGLNKEKDQFEVVRLLYVAATRARSRLHLFGHVGLDKKNHHKPVANTLLHTLWPVVQEHFANSAQPPAANDAQALKPKVEKRLPPDWQLALPKPPQASAPAEPNRPIDFEWAGDTARHVGTLVHRYLERIAQQGLEHWPLERLDTIAPQIEVALANLGVDPEKMPQAIDKTLRALRYTLQDETGRWILSPHQDHACELPLTFHDEHSRHYIIDRTFIDEEGTRWIVDYKTGDHQDADVDAFLDAEQARYREQLENYGRLMAPLENRTTKLALYFPLLRNMRSWQFEPST